MNWTVRGMTCNDRMRGPGRVGQALRCALDRTSLR
jgi:hypothetical protein